MKRKGMAYLICLLTAALVLAIFSSTTSPLYGLEYGDYYGNHSSSALLVGKEWLSGRLPYRDLFSAGGPLYYLIQRIGWAVGGRTGVWILQIVWMSVGLFLIQQICRRFTSETKSFLLMAVGAIAAAATLTGGNSREEFCILLSVLMLYLFVLSRERGDWRRRDRFLAGIIAGAVVMMDGTAGGAIYGALLYLIVRAFAEGKTKKGLACAVQIGMGAALIPVLFAAAFLFLGAGKEMAEAAVVVPFRMLWDEIGNGTLLLHNAVKCIPYLLLAAAGIWGIVKKKEDERGILAWIGIGLFLFGLLGDGKWYHYLNGVFCCPLLGLLWMEHGKGRNVFAVLYSFCAVGVAVIFGIPLSHFAEFVMTEDVSGYTQLMGELRTYRESYPDNEIFMIDMPAFFYLDAEITPQYRYFADQSEYEGVVEGIREDLNEYITNACNATILIVKSRGMAYESFGDYNMAGMYSHNREILSVYERMEQGD